MNKISMLTSSAVMALPLAVNLWLLQLGMHVS
ncbi:hypothetical protein LOK49_LG10G00736 [Camellia lanceoleosa]|uniref:Uncharacterized protein n=1 Tax=Camellia lanceoleosa TaxID=1840588 RepID=A0ACC0G751_9ERIC|nr:hypothetical protein LOK49_LG10G00736 [Camellia lanceoleosa]